jgi:hypothetical protein
MRQVPDPLMRVSKKFVGGKPDYQGGTFAAVKVPSASNSTEQVFPCKAAKPPRLTLWLVRVY